MTTLLTLSDDNRQNERFKEKSDIFARIFTKHRIKIYFSTNIATRASGLINSFMFVHCHKQRIVSVYEDRNVH